MDRNIRITVQVDGVTFKDIELIVEAIEKIIEPFERQTLELTMRERPIVGPRIR